MKKSFYFFTFNSFSKGGGGMVRVLGVLNALAEDSCELTLVSNAVSPHNLFHENIQHIDLRNNDLYKHKRLFQFLLGVFPIAVTNLFFNKSLKFYKSLFISHPELKKTLYTFEYLDNSVGYWLYKNKIIDSYINDVHGVAHLEFEKAIIDTTSIVHKLVFQIKLKVSKKLDKKVFSSAKKMIFSSKALEAYFCSNIPAICEKDNVILPNLISYSVPYECHNTGLTQQLQAIKKIDDRKVLLFIGSFKRTSGVVKLIEVVKEIQDKVKLIAIGDGPLLRKAKEFVYNQNLKKSIFFIERRPYEDLKCFYDIADIVICPDEDNLFSQLIIHVKYFDAIKSSKPTISASFESLKEINKNQLLSFEYTPSNYKELKEKILEIVHGDLQIETTKERKEKLSSLEYKNHIHKFYH